MKFENVLQLQSEIFQNDFDFVELPGELNVAFSDDGAPTFVNPTALDDDIILVEPAAVSELFPEPLILGEQGADQVLSTDPTIGNRPAKPTDLIALGVGGVASGGSPDFELVVLYQDRSVENTPLLQRIETRSRGEARISFVGEISAYSPWHRQKNESMRIGSSVAHKTVSFGTLSCFVRDRVSGDVGILSNNHVLANTNQSALGDDILQPGKSDGGTAADKVAELKGYVPLLFGGISNSVDCAWAIIDDIDVNENVRDRFDSAGNFVGALNGNVAVQATPGDPVTKVGRTTGYTTGEIDAVNVNNLSVNMGAGSRARFDNQIQIASLNGLPFSLPGDSGSLIVNTESNPVGLLYSGSKIGGFNNTGLTWANPLGVVLNKLNLEII